MRETCKEKNTGGNKDVFQNKNQPNFGGVYL